MLTKDQRTLKLVDFGLAREETVTEMMIAKTGTYRWMAPEVIFLIFFFSFLSKIKIFKCFFFNSYMAL